MLDEEKQQEISDPYLPEKKQKIIELLTPREWMEAYAIDEGSISSHLIVATYDGHDLDLVVHKWSDLLEKYDIAFDSIIDQLSLAEAQGRSLDEQEADDLLRDAWLEVAG